MARSKLPENLGSDIFSDSPLRATETRRVALVAPEPLQAEPTTPTPVAVEPEAKPAPALAEVVTMPTETVEPREPERTAKSPNAKTSDQVKLTIYLPKKHVDALEAEVYRRRKSGDRIGNTDLMRELVANWVATRKS